MIMASKKQKIKRMITILFIFAFYTTKTPFTFRFAFPFFTSVKPSPFTQLRNHYSPYYRFVLKSPNLNTKYETFYPLIRTLFFNMRNVVSWLDYYIFIHYCQPENRIFSTFLPLLFALYCSFLCVCLNNLVRTLLLFIIFGQFIILCLLKAYITCGFEAIDELLL